MRSWTTIAATLFTASVAHADLGDLLHKLTAEDRAEADAFGFSVAVSGTTAVIGARFDDDFGPSSGSAYLFDTGAGEQLRKLLPDDGFSEDQFGTSVGIDGTTVIVGAPRSNNDADNTGSVYLFDAVTGAQLAKLVAADATRGDSFGRAVAISGTTALVGAIYDDARGTNSGSAYLFDAKTRTQLHKLLADDGTNQDHFGAAVAIGGAWAVVGAPRHDGGAQESGAAYLFDAVTGEQLAKLLPRDPGPAVHFGESVAIDGTVVIVGAPGRTPRSPGGAAYLFDARTREQIGMLRAPDGVFGGQFGISVAIRGTTALVGARFAHGPVHNSAGAAYLFDITTGERLASLRDPNGATFDYFGAGVAVSRTAAVVAAPQDDLDGDSGAGSVSVFDAIRCPADLDGSGAVDFDDIVRVLDAWGEPDAPEDLDGSGTVDFADLQIVLGAWGACP